MMAPRSLLSSVLAMGVLAASMQLARGPAVPKSPAVEEGMAAHATTHASTSSAPVATWSDAMKRDPRGMGRRTAEEELQSKLCAFTSCQGAESAANPASIDSMYRGQPEVMIAIAPDPVHTHLALLFDRSIDGIEDALQDSGWYYQGHWMPWPVGGEQESGSIEDREEAKLYQEGREELPGLILLRRSDKRAGGPARPPLVIFVVGDSPTIGVNATQFRAALDRYLELSPPGAPLRILGPTFTGSGPSLRALLRDAKDRDGKTPVLDAHKTSIASGSVTDWRCSDFLPGDAQASQHDDCGAGENHFTSFGADGNWLLQQTWSFLQAHGQLRLDEMAQLTEDESGFGALLSKSDQSSRGGSNAKGFSSTSEVLRLTFPRGIAHLRTAYQKNSIWGFGGSSGGASSVSLNLDFAEPQRAADSIPSYAQQQMPVSQEGSMGQVAAILEQHRIKAVLVSATDVLDELFVAQILARQAPNVMVILRGTDVLFLRSSNGDVFRNMYTVSPWPLIPANAGWSEAAGSQPFIRAFPSGDAQGTYTAMRFLLGERTNELQDYRSPLPGDVRGADASGRPPLWFSAIGHGEFWPIALLNDPPLPGSSEPPLERSSINLPAIQQMGEPASLDGEKASMSQRLLLLVGCAITLLHVGKCLQWKLLDSFFMRYNLHDPTTYGPKLGLQLGITVLQIFALCVLYEYPARWSTAEAFWAALFVAVMIMLALTVSQLCWLIATRKKRENLDVRPRLRDGMAFHVFLVGLVLLAAGAIWYAVWFLLPLPAPAPDGMLAFFQYRSRHPLSGTCPVLPLMIVLGGLEVILFSHLVRLRFTPSMAPRLPGGVAPSLNCPSRETMRPLDSLLEWPIAGATLREKMKTLSGKAALFSAVFIVALLFALFMGLPPHMLESRALQLGLPLLLFVLMVAMLWDLTMAAVVWSRLRVTCLIPLESSPLRRGFDAISGFTWRSLWLVPQNDYVQYRAITRLLEQASHRVLQETAREQFEGVSLRVAAARMWEALGAHQQGTALLRFSEVQLRIAAMAQQLLLKLSTLWVTESGLITASDRSREETTKEIDKALSSSDGFRMVAEEWVALTYVHYFRLILLQVRTRLASAAALYILLVWAITCYPFLNRHTLMIALSVLLAVLSLVIISTYASINRDPVLSRTTDVQPGKLDFDFYAKTASMVGIPLLGFVASQFPEVSSFLFSWIAPGMSAVK